MRILLLAAVLASPVLAQSVPDWAEAAPPTSFADKQAASMMPPSPPGGGAPTAVPLDGGLALLALAGAGFAARKLRRSE